MWKAETEERRIRNLAKKEAEIAASAIYKEKKIQQIREANIAMVEKQKAERELVRAARFNKKTQ